MKKFYVFRILAHFRRIKLLFDKRSGLVICDLYVESRGFDDCNFCMGLDSLTPLCLIGNLSFDWHIGQSQGLQSKVLLTVFSVKSSFDHERILTVTYIIFCSF